MLERQLSTARSQLAQASLKAPFDGNIDDLMVKQGEMAQPGLPMLTIVSFDDMYIEADISERYISSFKTGDSVQVEFPALNRSLKSYIKSVGNVINEKSRTFKIEIQLPPNGEDIKPNLTAILNMVDYAADNALVIPTNIIQQDAQGHFVYVVDTSGEDPVSRKIHIERGVSYQGETQVVAGLEAGQPLVSQGYRDVADGMNIRIVNQ